LIRHGTNIRVRLGERARSNFSIEKILEELHVATIIIGIGIIIVALAAEQDKTTHYRGSVLPMLALAGVLIIMVLINL
jgi:hypothetical protein